jgi:hypothetical protein
VKISKGYYKEDMTQEEREEEEKVVKGFYSLDFMVDTLKTADIKECIEEVKENMMK